MEIYESSEITVHQLNELREENKKIQIQKLIVIVLQFLKNV